MLNLQDVKQAIDQFSLEELRELRAYLDGLTTGEFPLRAGTMDVDALVEAANALREGVSPQVWEEMLQAMNENYIEPLDDDGFPIT